MELNGLMLGNKISMPTSNEYLKIYDKGQSDVLFFINTGDWFNPTRVSTRINPL